MVCSNKIEVSPKRIGGSFTSGCHGHSTGYLWLRRYVSHRGPAHTFGFDTGRLLFLKLGEELLGVAPDLYRRLGANVFCKGNTLASAS